MAPASEPSVGHDHHRGGVEAASTVIAPPKSSTTSEGDGRKDVFDKDKGEDAEVAVIVHDPEHRFFQDKHLADCRRDGMIFLLHLTTFRREKKRRKDDRSVKRWRQNHEKGHVRSAGGIQRSPSRGGMDDVEHAGEAARADRAPGNGGADGGASVPAGAGEDAFGAGPVRAGAVRGRAAGARPPGGAAVGLRAGGAALSHRADRRVADRRLRQHAI